MIKKNTGVLILTPFFSPNIGGVETHLDDLVSALDEKGYNVFVQTYSPLLKSNLSWESKEKRGNNIEIQRYRWFGHNLMYKLERYPFFDFLYLTPYLFFRVFFFMLENRKKIDVVHAQGLNASFIGILIKKIFKKKLVTSLHAIYKGFFNPKTTGFLVKWVLEQSGTVLGMSKAVSEQFVLLKADKAEFGQYRYWVDLECFCPRDQQEARKEVGVKDQFTVLFVGRLVEIKGVKVFLEAAKSMPEVQFLLVGYGPLEPLVRDTCESHKNIRYLGQVENADLPLFYNIADVFCIPSIYDEGLGRVLMEAIACGVPIVGSNRGGIPDAVDDTVSIILEPTPENLQAAFLELYEDQEKLAQMQKNCRKYAEANYSKKNVELIEKNYN